MIVLLAWLFLVDLPAAVVRAIERGGCHCHLEVRPTQVALSGDVVVTLTVDGPAPLTAETVRPPADWRLRRCGPAETARGHFRQWFRLSPTAAGDIALTPPALTFRSGAVEPMHEVTWEPVPIRVTTAVPRVDQDEARNVTAAEEVPPAESAWGNGSLWFTVTGALVGLAILVWRIRQGRRPTVPPSPEATALAALDRIGPDEVVALDSLLRNYVQSRFGVISHERTTSELLRSLGDLTPPWPNLEEWRIVLERIELAKFAQAAFAAGEWPAFVAKARELVAATHSTV